MTANEQQLLDDMKTYFIDFKCTLQDLRNPSEEFVTNFYSYWLQEFEVDINNVVQAQFSQTNIIGPYQDSHSGMIHKGNLLRSIRAFDVVPDFGMLDIISPTPKRIQTVLAAFINFYNCSDDRVTCLIKKRKTLKQRKEKLSKIKKEKEDLKENLNNVIKNIAQLQDNKLQVEDKIVQLQQKSSEFRMEKGLLKTKTDDYSEKLREQKNIIQKINKEDSLITSKIKECSSLIVDSPLSILADLKSLQCKHDEMYELSDQKRDMVQSKMQSHEKLQRVLHDQQKRVLQLDELFTLLDQHRALMQTATNTETTTSIIQEELKELKSLLTTHSNKMFSRQEALQTLHLRWKTLKTQLTESIEATIRELNQKKNTKSEMINSLKEDAAIQERIDSLYRDIKTHINCIQDDFEQLGLYENEYFERIDTNLSSYVKNIYEEAEKWLEQ